MRPRARLLVFSVFLTAAASASTGGSWFCRDGASVRQGDRIKSCGVGASDSEAGARKLALRNAGDELRAVCDLSDDCRSRPLRVVPLRSECERIATGGYKCFRGLEAQILGSRGRTGGSAALPSIARQLRELNRLHTVTEGIGDEVEREFNAR